MEIREEIQRNRIADEVAALTAVVRPILEGTLYALRKEVVEEAGGYSEVKLMMLPRLYRQGDGDCGICFEWAVHAGITNNDNQILERIDDSLKLCKVPGSKRASILFGAEKTGAVQLIDTADQKLTDDSRLLVGTRGQPIKLKQHINSVAAAFRRPNARLALPHSISGLWKADLFMGCTDSDRWVGTTVKINEKDLEAAKGLRVGIVPSRQGASDAVRKDDRRNLVICPLPHDASFMEIFYRGWGIVQQFISADAFLPKEVALPSPADRQVAKYLVDRRKFSVVDVIEALGPISQPELLEPRQLSAEVILKRAVKSKIGAIVVPVGATNS
ncbi:hypothetical protein [Paludisphaera borealis]|uniref:Uncharacterized protein n=1 Tax=Paludisphaera borealis TaxID=1387353 RepID=A0A1U7CSE5_9BACT|nr:hypothetical protein [Paludisphaera borealis]APW61819.1 hypothetical protein BSF38_03348 [Paludisphaera borealis]